MFAVSRDSKSCHRWRAGGVVRGGNGVLLGVGWGGDGLMLGMGWSVARVRWVGGDGVMLGVGMRWRWVDVREMLKVGCVGDGLEMG